MVLSVCYCWCKLGRVVRRSVLLHEEKMLTVLGTGKLHQKLAYVVFYKVHVPVAHHHCSVRDAARGMRLSASVRVAAGFVRLVHVHCCNSEHASKRWLLTSHHILIPSLAWARHDEGSGAR